jgi:hypothetical protein
MKVEYCQKEMILKVFPSAGACFREGVSLLKENLIIFLLLILFSVVVDIPMGISEVFSETESWNNFSFQFFNGLSFLYYLCLVTPIGYGIAWLFLKAVRKEEFVFEDLFVAFRYFIAIVIVKLLLLLLIGVGFLFFIIPGVFLLCRFAFVPYLIMDKKLTAVKAIEESYRLSKKYFWTILVMGFLSFLIIILGLLAFGVGVLFSFIWIQSAFAILYSTVEELHYHEIHTDIKTVD